MGQIDFFGLFGSAQIQECKKRGTNGNAHHMIKILSVPVTFGMLILSYQAEIKVKSNLFLKATRTDSKKPIRAWRPL